MSTPAAKPFRSDSVRWLMQKGVESLERRDETEGAGDPAKILKIFEDEAPASPREDCVASAQMVEAVREHPDLEHGDNRRTKEGEDDKPGDGGPEAQDQSSDARGRHAQDAEIDKGYKEKLEGFADDLQTLRQEAKPADPEQSTPLRLDGMVLQRFIHSADFDQLERGTNRAILPIGIACAVVATIVYYLAVGNPFASGSNESPLRPELRNAMGLASVWEQASGVSQSESARGQKLANAELSGKKRQQARQFSDPVPTAIEHPAEQAASAQTSSALPLTPALASAAASAPVEPQLAPARAMPTRPSGMAPDEIQLLLKQGQEFVAAGDLATARVVLRRAAEAGAVAAAFALAQCYDPRVLTRMRVWGVAPDIGEARRWYEIARQMGSAEAARYLEFLPSE